MYSITPTALLANGEPIALASDPATLALLTEFVMTEAVVLDLGPLDVAEPARLERKCAEAGEVEVMNG